MYVTRRYSVMVLITVIEIVINDVTVNGWK